MKSYILALFAATAVDASAATLVSLTVDQWQGSFPYQWVEQTQSSPGFSPGQEYAGFFSGTVDGQRWLFMCTAENTTIQVGQTYTFTQYSSGEYLNTPFESNGTPVTGDQKESVAALLDHAFGIGDISGFVAPGVQSLVGVELTPTVQLSLDAITPQRATLGQMVIWEIVHDTTGVIDLSAGSLQWTWQNGSPIAHEDYAPMVQSIAGNIIPEPQPASMLSLVFAFYIIRRRR